MSVEVRSYTELVEAVADETNETFTISRRYARGLLDYIEELKKNQATMGVGDIVREVGEEEPTGEITLVEEHDDEMCYRVKLYRPTRYSKDIFYYEGEIELIERAPQ
jgi:hypothetical protein